jgi:prophage regulatory protein
MSVRFVRLREVVSITGLSRSTIYSEIKREKFPRPHPIGRRAVAWRSDDIESWFNSRSAAGAC